MQRKKVFSIIQKASQRLKELQESEQVVKAPSRQFDYSGFKTKLDKDMVFLEHLYNEFIGDEALKPKFESVVEETAIAAFHLLEEANVPAKLITPAVEFSFEPLSESETVAHYKRAFNMILEESFNKKNLSGELLFENAGDGQCVVRREVSPDATKIVKICVKSGVLDSTDPEAAVKYAQAEQSIIDAIKQIFMPRGTAEAVENYENSVDDGYKEIFGTQFTDNMDKFRAGCTKIGSLLAPFIFKKALEASKVDDVKFDPTALAGITTKIKG